MVPHHNGEVKVPEMEMKLGDDLVEKNVIMLKSDKVLGLGKQWSPVKGLFQYQGLLYGVVKHWGTPEPDLG